MRFDFSAADQQESDPGLEDVGVARAVVLFARFLVVRAWGWSVRDHLIFIHATRDLGGSGEAKSAYDLRMFARGVKDF